MPFPPRDSDAVTARQGLDHLSVIAVLLLTAVLIAVRAAGHEEYLSAISLLYIPAVAFCAMRRNALDTYVTLAVSGTLLCVALSWDANALPTSLTAAAPPELEDIIRSTGFFRAKAKSLIGFAKGLVGNHGGSVPRTMAELVPLPKAIRVETWPK